MVIPCLSDIPSSLSRLFDLMNYLASRSRSCLEPGMAWSPRTQELEWWVVGMHLSVIQKRFGCMLGRQRPAWEWCDGARRGPKKVSDTVMKMGDQRKSSLSISLGVQIEGWRSWERALASVGTSSDVSRHFQFRALLLFSARESSMMVIWAHRS